MRISKSIFIPLWSSGHKRRGTVRPAHGRLILFLAFSAILTTAFAVAVLAGANDLKISGNRATKAALSSGSNDNKRARRVEPSGTTGLPSSWSPTALAHYQEPFKTLVVNTANDEIDTNVGDGICTTPTGNCSLRAALEEVNAGRANVINFSLPPNSIITLTVPLDPIRNDVTINGPGAHNLTVQRSSAPDTPNFRIFTITGSVTISGLTVKNGQAPHGGVNGQHGQQGSNGGGISNDGISTFIGLVVTGNTAGSGGNGTASGGGGNGGGGGGILNTNRLTVINCVITNNRAGHGGEGGNGGLGGDSGGITSGRNLVIINSTISNNFAGNGGKGGINGSGGSGGRGGSGGGLNGSATTIIGSTISGNRSGRGGDGPGFAGATAGEGGGIVASGPVVITNSTISNNTTAEGGSGTRDSSGGGHGGGISVGHSVYMTNCTITNNRTSGYYGGHGGGIYAPTGTVNLKNTIVANNTVATGGVTDGQGPDLFGLINSLDYNLIKDTTGANIKGTTTHNITGLDPLLGPLAGNGGLTPTHELLPGSPAIDAGDDCITKSDGCLPPSFTAELPKPYPTDQRGTGYPRLASTTVDIGSFEVQVVVPPPPVTLQFSAASYSVNEGSPSVEIAVSRSGNPNVTASVGFATNDGAGSQACSVKNGSAIAQCDYISQAGTLHFATGESSKTISIQLLEDGWIEGAESFTVSLSNPSGANLGSTQTTAITITDNDGAQSSLHLILEESGQAPNQVVAMDSLLFLRDPFPVVNEWNLLDQASDQNTRVIVFVANLQLAQSAPASSVIVNLVEGNNQSYEIAAEDVHTVPGMSFAQVRFRLPNNLSPGTYAIKVKVHDQESNSGTIRIKS